MQQLELPDLADDNDASYLGLWWPSIKLALAGNELLAECSRLAISGTSSYLARVVLSKQALAEVDSICECPNSKWV